MPVETPWIEGSRCSASQYVQPVAGAAMGRGNWACHCIPKDVYYIYMLTASVFILLMGH